MVLFLLTEYFTLEVIPVFYISKELVLLDVFEFCSDIWIDDENFLKKVLDLLWDVFRPVNVK